MRKLLLIIFGLLLLASCLRDLDMPSYDLNVSIPIFITEIKPWHILPDSLLYGDDYLSLVYERTLFEIKPDFFISPGDTLSYISLRTPFNVTYQPGTRFYDRTQEKVFNAGDARIENIKVDSGYIILEIQNTLAEPIILEYYLPAAKKGGQSLRKTMTVPGSGSTPGTNRYKVDISDYSFDMRGLSGNRHNRVVFQISGMIPDNGNPTYFSNIDSLSIFAYFDGLILSEVRGYFGSADISEQSSTHMQVFEMFKSGTLSTHDVRASIIIENGMGMDARFRLDEMRAENSLNSQSISLQHQLIGTNINISRATETPGMPNAVNPSLHSFDLATGNIKSMLELLPNYLHYEYTGMLNPLGNVSSGNDFYIKPNPFRGVFVLDVPLKLSMNQLKLSEYVEISIDKKANYLKSGIFSLKAHNSYPFDISLNLLLRDADKSIIDTLLAHALIGSGSGVNNETFSHINFRVSEKQIENLYLSSDILVEVFLMTPPGSTANIRFDHRLYLTLSGDIEVHLGKL